MRRPGDREDVELGFLANSSRSRQSAQGNDTGMSAYRVRDETTNGDYVHLCCAQLVGLRGGRR